MKKLVPGWTILDWYSIGNFKSEVVVGMSAIVHCAPEAPIRVFLALPRLHDDSYAKFASKETQHKTPFKKVQIHF